MNVLIKTKRMVLLLLFFMLGLVWPSFGQAAVPFSDINSNHWAYKSIEWAYNNKVISGYSNGTFGPKRTLTESEFIVMLSRYDCSNSSWSKSKPGDRHWAASEYAYAKSKNIPLKGYDNTKLRDQPVSRGQVARIVAAFHGFDLNQEHAVQYMYIKQLSSGKTGVKNYVDYGAGQSLTRAEAAVFLHRLAGQGQCQMKGLTESASGKDNSKYPLPAHFLPEGTVVFPKPEDDDTTPPTTGPVTDSRIQAADIEKPTLIANGLDSTFITLSLKDCYGNPISYEETISFHSSSKAGGFVSSGQPPQYDHWKELDFTTAASTSAYVQTDGPDLTVKVTAPASTTVKSDTISFQLPYETGTNDKMACYRTPVTVDLAYTAKAELQVSSSQSTIAANGSSTAYVTAKIFQPGGQPVWDYNGRVRFYSAKGALLSTSDISFSNGTASTWVTSLSSSSPVEDTIYAELIQSDSRYPAVNSEIKSSRHSTSIFYDPGLSTITGCMRDDLEVAFIIDASDSMKRSDPERQRVSKSRELMQTLNAPDNIAVDFNNKGRYLNGPYSWNIVSPSLESVFQSGGTNIADGMDEAFSRFTGTNKVAILVTDGKSNERQVLAKIEQARNQGITVYTIGLGSKKQLNEALLQKVAQETGGRYFHVGKSSEISTAYQTILNELSCGELYLGCSPSGTVFASPSLRMTSDTFYMDTFIDEACSEVERVVLRFHSLDGTIDYDLIYRGQHYFALKKDRTEIDPLYLQHEGTFLAYDKYGTLIGKQTIPVLQEN